MFYDAYTGREVDIYFALEQEEHLVGLMLTRIGECLLMVMKKRELILAQ